MSMDWQPSNEAHSFPPPSRPEIEKSKTCSRNVIQELQEQTRKHKIRLSPRLAKPVIDKKATLAASHDKTKQPAKKALQNCPKKLAGGTREDMTGRYGYKPRRFKLPGELAQLTQNGIAARLESLETENTMLKNEVNVTNREITELLERLREDEKAIEIAQAQIKNLESDKKMLCISNEILKELVVQLKTDKPDTERYEVINKYKSQIRALTSEVSVLRERIEELMQTIENFNVQKKYEPNENKLGAELKNCQSLIKHLQEELVKSDENYKDIEMQWDSYKIRVKSMLAAKDKDILTLQQGVNLTEDTKLLVEELINLKQERDDLKEAVEEMCKKNEKLTQCLTSIENNYSTSEQELLSLRKILNDEREARCKLKLYNIKLSKVLKTLQEESEQTMARLRSALREKEVQLSKVLETPVVALINSSINTINVADYDSEHSVGTVKIQQLNNKLHQRQAKIEELMATNNKIKLQLIEMERKFKEQEMRTITALSSTTEKPKWLPRKLNEDHDDQCNFSFGTKVTILKMLKKIYSRPRTLTAIFMVYMVFLHLCVASVLIKTE